MNRVLFCTDGSAYSRVCGEYVVWLCRRTQAHIDALYLTDIRQFEIPLVADLSGSLGVQPYQDVVTQLQEMERQKSSVIEESTLKNFADAGMADEVTYHHRTGLLVDCLSDFESNVDVVVLGKRGENADFASEHLGSTMERVVRASQKPCLVTSRSFRVIKKLVLAYDGGQSCCRAVQFLADSNAFRDLQLHIVSAIEGDKRGRAENRLREAEKMLTECDYHPTCALLEGVVEDSMRLYVEKQDIDLLVMGAYGHSRIRHLLIGSTTTAMIRGCRIPVLCFR